MMIWRPLFRLRFLLRLSSYFIVSLLLLLALFFAANRIWPLPLQELAVARVVTAEDGTPLWRFADADGIWRYPVDADKVSPYYMQALLTYEDRWFWHHPGINPFSIARASWQFVRNGKIVSGGSTLSMQVARIIDPQPRTVRGKLHQIFRTLQLEWSLSKPEILQLYLNRAPYGGTLQGIAAASWTYLGKSPSHLTPAEAAMLAVLPQAPSRLRPDRFPLRAKAARDKVLDRLAQYHVWPQQQVDEIKQESIWLAPRQAPQLAPLLSLRLVQTIGKPVITSTLDATLQRQLEDMASGWYHQLPEKTSVGVLVVDSSNMAVRGYVGSVNFNDNSRFGHVDMVKAVRSPGSTLKPLLYGLALDDGLIHAESLLQDVPRRFGDYRPGNFDTGFHGAVSTSEALIRSLNLPAVQVLDAYGPKRFVGDLRNVGVDLRFAEGSEPSLAVILGGTGSRLDQLVQAYSVFARGGKVAQLRFTPTDPLVERKLMSPGAAWIIRRILGGQELPQPDDVLPANVPLAWKTGTSYGYRDAWAIGLNPHYLIGVWVGRPDGTPVAGQYGFASAVPLLNQVNNLLLSSSRYSGRVNAPDPRPDSVSIRRICWPGGQPLAEGDSNCRQSRLSWILDGTIPPTLSAEGQEVNTGSMMTLWVNSQGKRVAPDCPDAQRKVIALWPTPLEPWLSPQERRAVRLPAADSRCPPLNKDQALPLLLLGIRDNAVLNRLPGEKSLDLTLHSQGGSGQRWWFLNGVQVPVSAPGVDFHYKLTQPGNYQLTVLDESSQVTTLNFTLQ